MMKKSILVLMLVLSAANSADALDYYVRKGGSTSENCTGRANVDYDGSGTGEACAFNHLSWAIGAKGTSRVISGSDTVTIVDDGTGYAVGNGMPNTVGCNPSNPLDCILDPPPNGTPTSPTIIRGSEWNTGCANPAELWGTQGVESVMNLDGLANVKIECIEITDHSNCAYTVGTPLCNKTFPNSATFAKMGLKGKNITNLILRNVDVHGLGHYNLFLSEMNGTTTLDHVKIDGGYFGGWDGDGSTVADVGSINNGIMLWDHVYVRANGCREAYPRSASFSLADYDKCVDQNTGNAYGDGVGSDLTGGDWYIKNSIIGWNSSDGLDLLYCKNCGTVNIDKSWFEANNGNNVKVTTRIFNFTNSVNIANCQWHRANGKLFSPTAFTDCRAGGVPFSMTPLAGSVWTISNSTVYTATWNGGSAVMENKNRYFTANGTETYTWKNNIFVQSPLSPGKWVPFYNVNLTGSPATAYAANTNTNSVIYNFQTNPSGSGNVFTAPAWAGTVTSANGSNSLAAVQLTSNVGGGTSVTMWNTNKDFYNFPQNASIDKGAFQYGTSQQLAQAGQACVATTDCASGTCDNFACTGSCPANGGACASGATCCSTYCNGSSQCANPPTCGDNALQPGEICDGTTVPSNCILQGHTGGTLACAANCLSFDTSGCNDTLVFPLTPILDNFNRTNEGPPAGSNWTTLQGGLKVSSNAMVGHVSGGTANREHWNPGTFSADEEVYATVTNKGGTTNDSVKLNLRRDLAASNSYQVRYTNNTSGTDTLKLYRVTGGSATELVSYNQEVSTGDSFGMSAVGSSLKVYYKAAAGSWTSLGTTTDSTYSAGGSLVPQIEFTTTSPAIDNFGGGSLNPVTCGNSLKESEEICDGTDLASHTCVSEGFDSGTLACATDCNSFDTSACVTDLICGDGVKDLGEACDGADLGSATCANVGGFSSGTLACDTGDPLCQTFDTSGCVASSGSGTATGGITFR